MTELDDALHVALDLAEEQCLPPGQVYECFQAVLVERLAPVGSRWWRDGCLFEVISADINHVVLIEIIHPEAKRTFTYQLNITLRDLVQHGRREDSAEPPKPIEISGTSGTTTSAHFNISGRALTLDDIEDAKRSIQQRPGQRFENDVTKQRRRY